MDLDGYFRRIGYGGARRAGLDELAALHVLHPQAIPFENLAAYTGETPRLDLDSLEEKLVRGGRGGWCFEQNLLFGAVLRALGFEVTWLAARVLWNRPAGAQSARTHMLLRVEIERVPYLADVGFGRQVLTAPLRLEADVEQATPHEPFRLQQVGNDWVLQSRIQGDWHALYRFDLQPQQLADYELVSWHLANHPDSLFRAALNVTRTLPGRRIGLRDRQLFTHTVDARGVASPTQARELGSVAEIEELLAGTFGLRVPTSAALECRLRALF